MKPLQPILDMLERADNPRARVIEAMKHKPAKQEIPLSYLEAAMRMEIARQGIGSSFNEQMRRQAMQQDQMQRMQQWAQYTTTTNSTNILGGILGGGL